MRNPHNLTVAQSMAAAGSAANQGVRSGFEIVKVIRQAGDVDEPIDRQLDEPAE